MQFLFYGVRYMGLHGQESGLLLVDIIMRDGNGVELFPFCYIPPPMSRKIKNGF